MNANSKGGSVMVRAQQYRMFWLRLAKMMEAGSPLLRAINIIISQTKAKERYRKGDDKFDYKLKRFLRDAASRIQEGDSQGLPDAMKASGLFSDVETDVIEAGLAQDAKSGEYEGLEAALNGLAYAGLEDRYSENPNPLFKIDEAVSMTRAEQYEYFYKTLHRRVTDEKTLLEALEEVSHNLDPPLKKAVKKIQEKIIENSKKDFFFCSMSEAMLESGEFSYDEVVLIDTGEEYEFVADMFNYLAKLSAPIVID